MGLICLSAHQLLNISHLTEYSLRSIYLEAFEENCFEDFDLQIFSTLPVLDLLDLDVMTDLCSETTGRVILVVLEEHPLLTPEVEETKTDVELRALPEELSNSLLTFIKTLGMSMGEGNAYANIPSQFTDSASHVHARGSG